MSRIRSLLALAILAIPGLASATTYYYSGQQCQWYDQVAGLQYSQYGLYNSMSSGWRGAYCPANGYVNSNLVKINAGTVVYYDGSTASPVQCSWEMTNWDGSLYWSPTLYSCGTYGGCSSNANAASTGIGQLNHTNPISQSLYPLNVTAYCLVPNNSTIYGYNMTTN
jgi:hypothetical protein